MEGVEAVSQPASDAAAAAEPAEPAAAETPAAAVASTQSDTSCVTVAVRARPLTSQELVAGCRESITAVEESRQLVAPGDRSFQFDHVFGPDSSQVLPLLPVC